MTGDNNSFSTVADLLVNLSEKNEKLKINKYESGDLQDTVYDVNGGFEDWAYGASWDTDNVSKTCFSDNYPEKWPKTYDDVSNRNFVYLVEASNNKIPAAEKMGNELAIY